MRDHPEFDVMELAAIRAVFRHFYRRWRFATLKEAAERLVEISPSSVNEEQVESWLEGHTIARTELPLIADAALTIIAEHKDEVVEQFGNAHSANYIADILSRHRNIPVTPKPLLSTKSGAETYASIIFKNWGESVHSGPTNIVPGLYQIFRLYKPTRELSLAKEAPGLDNEQHSADGKSSPIGSYGGPDLHDHVVICELVYVDSKNLECVLITAERHKYIGTLYINHEDILFGLLQRKTGSRLGVNQRFICMKLVRAKLTYYSGLMIKIGDTTSRPLASECLSVRIPHLPEHADLYNEIERLRAAATDGERVPKNSVIAEYITPNPPVSPYDPAAPAPEWEGVKFVRDFPALLNLTKMHGSGTNKFRLLREPSRTLDQNVLTILGRQKEMALSPYRRKGA